MSSWWRPVCAALVLALGLGAGRHAPRRRPPPIVTEDPAPPAPTPPGEAPAATPPEVDRGEIPATAPLSLDGLGEAPFLSALGLTLSPPARLWPVRGPGGQLTVEHSPLEPATRYLLDLGWVGGTGARVRFATRPERRAIRRGPGVGRIELTAPVWAHFGCEVDRAAVEASWRLEPATPGAFEWTDDRTVRFVPARLRLGTLYQVTVGGKTAQGEDLEEVRWSFRTLIPPPTHVAPGEGEPIVLTFDDGVRNPLQAVKLLDLLEKLRVKAILFPVGQWARRYPDLVDRARREGHRICNHSDTHANLSLLTDEVMRGEILRGAGRGECDLLRPPSMGTSPRVERMAASLGYRVYLWDVDSRDWEGLEAEDITNRILSRVRPGAVVLLHMHGAHTLEALPGLVAALEKAGYRPTYEGAKGSPTPPEGSPAPGDPPAADGPVLPAGMPEIGPLIEAPGEGGAGGPG